MLSILSIDIGGSKVLSAVGEIRTDPQKRLSWSLARKKHRPVAPTATVDDVLTLIRETLHELFEEKHEEIQAVGINVPGLADPKDGIWIYAPFSGIGNLPIARIFREELNKPVFIENDVNACALAEKYFGATRDEEHFLWVTVSNGVGGGLVLNNEVFTGSVGNAGEIGHFCVEEDTEHAIACGCGNFGCLEAQAAGPGILKRYQKQTGFVRTALEIANLAKSGDRDAIFAFEKTGYYLGKAIAAATNLLNLGKVILGGGVSESFELFYPELKRTFDRQVFRKANPQILIEKTLLGTDAALAGAAAIACRGWNQTHQT